MPIRSGVLCAGASPGAAGFVVGTVPVTDTWLLKDWRIYNLSGALQNVTLLVANQANTLFAVLFIGAVAAGAFASGACWVAGGPGATVQAVGGAAGVHFWVSGTDLPGHL
jgi:hypothetical protein